MKRILRAINNAIAFLYDIDEGDSDITGELELARDELEDIMDNQDLDNDDSDDDDDDDDY